MNNTNQPNIKKERIDVLLCKRGLCESRNKALAYIIEGKVLVDGKVILKAGEKIIESANITIKESDEYVSRGAYKLLKAKETFNITFKDKICLDIGASTGGFTHLMLKDNAKKVICVDVGYGILHPLIRNHPNVIVCERQNIREFNLTSLNINSVDFITCDVSFISVLKFANKFLEFSHLNTEVIILIKPQFEALKNEVKKGGKVLNKDIHIRIILNFINTFSKLGFKYLGLCAAPKFKDMHNIEYLIFFKKDDSIISDQNFHNEIKFEISEIVNKTFIDFDIKL